jgi:hypothetical protein
MILVSNLNKRSPSEEGHLVLLENDMSSRLTHIRTVGYEKN